MYDCLSLYTLLILVIFLSGVKEKPCILFYSGNVKFLRALCSMNFANAEIPSKKMAFRESCQVNILSAFCFFHSAFSLSINVISVKNQKR